MQINLKLVRLSNLKQSEFIFNPPSKPDLKKLSLLLWLW